MASVSIVTFEHLIVGRVKTMDWESTGLVASRQSLAGAWSERDKQQVKLCQEHVFSHRKISFQTM